MVNVDEQHFFLKDLIHVPRPEHDILSPSKTTEQGFQFEMRPNKEFTLSKDGRVVVLAKEEFGTWRFEAKDSTETSFAQQFTKTTMHTHSRPQLNFTLANGVASLEVWHNRLRHICTQYLIILVDQGLINGMLLSNRKERNCETCHIANQRRGIRNKKKEHLINTPNELV